MARTEAGVIQGFVVQYEAYIKEVGGRSCGSIRCTGSRTKDILHPDGTQDKQPMRFGDYNIAFTFAIQDLKGSWRWYRMGTRRRCSDGTG